MAKEEHEWSWLWWVAGGLLLWWAYETWWNDDGSEGLAEDRSEIEALVDDFPSAVDSAEAAAGDALSPEAFNPPTPTKPRHFYDARDGVVYHYAAAISEDDRKAGKAAQDIVSFAYLGTKRGKHILARVGLNETILHRATCAEPCKVINYEDGSRVAYSEGSIIGAAFADAINGRLSVAEAFVPSPTPTARSFSTESPASTYSAPNTEPPKHSEADEEETEDAIPGVDGNGDDIGAPPSTVDDDTEFELSPDE